MAEQTPDKAPQRRGRAVFYIGAVVVVLILGLQAFVLLAVRAEKNTPLPENFGNFERVRRLIQDDGKTDEPFSFAVVADVQDLTGNATFESILGKLREKPLKFLVIVGDGIMFGCEEQHRYWRWKWKTDFGVPFPVFYLPGNHDVDPKQFPIRRFEQIYGPTNFNFVYRGCLFVGLRVLPKPYDNTEARNYLRRMMRQGREKYRKVFVFMHMPPVHTDLWHPRAVNGEKEMLGIVMQFHPDYVFSGDHHAYRRTEVNGVRFIVTGGGGGKLKSRDYGHFHHAMVMRVAKDSVAEDIMMVSNRTSLFHMAGRFMFVKIYPHMQAHPVLTTLVDLGLAALLAWMIRRLLGTRPARRKTQVDREPLPGEEPARPTLARSGGDRP